MDSICKEIRKNILKISMESKQGHIPTSFSIIECLVAVYQSIRHNPKQPDWQERDLFVLSKGHASLGLYAVLDHFGYFKNHDIRTFGAFGSIFGCHPDRNKVPGIEASTGSLGHGIGLALGMAFGLTLHNTNRKVITLIGDGESNEGTIWEAFQVAENLNLFNFLVIIDYNQSQGRCLPLIMPVKKLQAFGWETCEIDGHNLNELKSEIPKPHNRPKVIIAHTKKGYGCKTLENNYFEWHRKSPTQKQLKQLIAELKDPNTA